MFTFTPIDDGADQVKVPYIEEARANFAPYYTSYETTTEPQAQAQVTAEMAKLGGGVYQFVQGVYQVAGQTRHGYEIRFVYGGAQGVIRVAGLPIRDKETKLKLRQIRTQALLNVRDWLKAALTVKVFSPDSDPLIGHLLLPDGKTTVREYIAKRGELPMLESSYD